MKKTGRENFNENIFHQSVCFNWKEALTLIKIIKKNKDQFIREIADPQLRTIIDKVVNYENDINDYLKQEENAANSATMTDDKNKGNGIKNFYLRDSTICFETKESIIKDKSKVIFPEKIPFEKLKVVFSLVKVVDSVKPFSKAE